MKSRIRITTPIVVLLSFSSTLICQLAFGSNVANRTRNAGTAAQNEYTLTIFVEEGRWKLNGHVFILLSDGKNMIYRGFYPNEAVTEMEQLGGIPGPLFRIAGGEVRDDSKVGRPPGLHHWDVKRTYYITKEGFDAALEGIEEFRKQGESWWLSHHCGDFAEAVAKTAGVPIELPLTVAGRNRPAVFGDYLRRHGGMLNKPAFAGHWLSEQTGENVLISPAANGYRMRLNGIDWALQWNEDVLVAQKQLTSSDVQMLYGSLPGRAASVLIGKPAGVVLTLSTDGRAIQVQLVAPGISHNARGENVRFIGAHTLTGILVRREEQQ